MNRITNKQLEALTLWLNNLTNNPIQPYLNGTAQVGNYHLSYCYGGVSLHQMVNAYGGARDVISCGHIPKRELFNLIHAYIKGLNTKELAA